MCSLRLTFVVILLLCAACTPDDPGPTRPIETPPGVIAVTVSTQGDFVDPDGYVVIVSRVGTAAGADYRQTVGGSGELSFPSIAPGQYVVRLDNLAEQCILQDPSLGTQRATSVTSGAVSRIAFSVACFRLGPPGGLRIRVQATFVGVPAVDSFTVLIDDQPARSIPANGSIEVHEIAPGLHHVTLKTRGCFVNWPGNGPSGETVSVRVLPGGSAEVRFNVVCVP